MNEPADKHALLTPYKAAKIAAVLSIVIIWQGLVRRPTAPASGDVLHDVPEARHIDPAASVLHVATFNIAGGVSPKDDQLDLARTAHVIEGIDLVGLEEVHGREMLESRDQAQILGETLHLPYLFAPSERRWWHDSFGNGVLCDLPVTRWERWPLSTSLSATNRSLLKVDLRYHDQLVHIFITHLDRHSDHDVELGAVITAFDDAPSPCILLGDLNTDTTDAQLSRLRAAPGVVDCIGQTMAGKLDPTNNDWIIARGFRCTAGGLKENSASDHLLAWADLELSQAAD